MGGDAVNLVLVVPVLLLSALLSHRGLVPARLARMGTLIYLLYNFLIYAVAVHLNPLFLVYCGVVGLSFYAFLGIRPSLSPSEIAERCGSRIPIKAMATVFFLIAIGFASRWLVEIIPAMVSGGEPNSVREAGLLTSPVHVLDLAVVIPGFVVTGIMLLRRRPIALIFAPILMTYLVLMIIALAGMLVSLSLKVLANGYTLAAFFVAAALGCALLLVRYLRELTITRIGNSTATAHRLPGVPPN